jgi:hypothetical protein
VAELASVSPYKAAGLLKHIKTQVREERRLWGKLEVPTGILDYLPKVHRQYLIKRGFNPNEIGTLWGVTGIGIHPDLAWRLFIPIYYKGDIVSWTTRLITDTTNEIRYRSAKETQERIPHKQLLYGEDYVRTSVIVHEGPTDVWKTGPGAVCTFGTGYKQTQITRLIKYPKRVICFDNEPTAQQRAKKLMNDLSCFPGETCNVLLDAKDAGSATEHEIKQLRKLLK